MSEVDGRGAAARHPQAAPRSRINEVWGIGSDIQRSSRGGSWYASATNPVQPASALDR